MNLTRTRRALPYCAMGAAVVALGLPSVATAQWWWPPDLQSFPTCPHPTSQINIRVSGQWPDNCVPNGIEVQRSGLNIDVFTRRDPPPGICLTVITPWNLSAEIGTLPAGTYSVYATHITSPPGPHPREFIGHIIVDPTCPPGPGACYPNCDGSTVQPVLNIDDFTCFINEFAAGLALPPAQQITHYANCDHSTTAPVLNIDDFTCFINQFAQGCP